ncbi:MULTISPECIES: hypothetical protein [Streptomyces]|uniref:Lipoprotein n=1 Tax=Streptomyces glycanivorans TaxID=3033808 RepID=A0ABY9JJH0_9ACTN|nr:MULTISPECIES: hypothetical protein [unclassified Streptomyces]WSQ80358.1 hypothetical protein OG725_26120 [Streptomyces sp. NBC_01213]TXS08607.1 hypothetical protein EAO68_31260 [Streptomyces sp. wa22]WLQ66939.1 hypothetical protein P8A20_26705 [Streptomyces sp. Alt3]WSR06300.1 hypothetical protein OG265_09910 [Streptomyces sp. NBC_01208]WSR51093.1 hypothetical protein OG279_27185 [Streptomyces sp. NBC_01201]
MAQQSGWRRGRVRRTPAAVRAGLALLTACGALTACGGGADGTDRPAVPPTASGTLEQLASKADCDPRLQTDAEELRQANCTTGDGRYVLATFATDRGQREWINEANDYGGSYLVGRRWVAVGDPEVVAALRGRLGGTVETASPHHSGNSGGGGSEEGHSGHHGS